MSNSVHIDPTTSTPSTSTTGKKPTLEELVGSLPTDVMAGIGGGARDWYIQILTREFSQTIGEPVTAAQIDAAIKTVNESNRVSSQSPTDHPSWTKAPAKKGSQAAAQIAKRFGGGAK